MKYFTLPDLGEGLHEAEVVEWHVHEGDTVKTDQLMVSVETAKAIVEIPSPCDAVIKKLHASPGELIHVGGYLVEFESDATDDKGTVVGEMKVSHELSENDDFIIGSAHTRSEQSAVQRNRRRIAAKGNAAQGNAPRSNGNHQSASHKNDPNTEPKYSQPLKGVRRSMAINMRLSSNQCVPVTLFDDVDIHAWKKQDTTLRLILAMRDGVKAEPLMNAWFDSAGLSLEVHEHIDLGLAVDTPDGLFVPVLRDIGQRKKTDIKNGLEHLKKDVAARSIPPKELMGYTIMLSNFGTLAGKHGTPVLVPPCVCILGAGQIYSRVVEHKGKFETHEVLPLSLTFDHQAATGGEAARFLAAVIASLQRPAIN